MNNDDQDIYNQMLDKVLSDFFRFEIKGDLYYSRNHLCFQEMNDNVFLVGFDSILTSFLSFINALILLPVNEKITEGKSFGWIVQSQKTFSVYSPLNAIIIEHNTMISDTPDILRNKVFPENWIMKLKLDNKTIELEKLLKAGKAEKWYDQIASKLQHEIIELIKENHPKQLITQFDGGTLSSVLLEILPRKYYIRILNSLLNYKIS